MPNPVLDLNDNECFDGLGNCDGAYSAIDGPFRFPLCKECVFERASELRQTTENVVPIFRILQ